ncbi:trk system potassium uptake protein TrkH [Nitrosomonas sp. Nm33]|nr:trk system potassium uptake protein TrkH [Nitrosomonas sp. Nm33]
MTVFSATAASINNLGPRLNQTGLATIYASLTDFQIWFSSFAMLLGRLEFYTLLIIFTAAFWRK